MVIVNNPLSMLSSGMVFQGLFSGLLWALSGTLLMLSYSCFESTFSVEQPLVLVIFICSMLVFFHDACATVILFGLLYKQGKLVQFGRALKVERGRLLFLSAVLGAGLSMIGYQVCIGFSGSIVALIVTASYPLLASVIAHLICKETINRMVFLGLLLCFLASVVLAMNVSEYSPALSNVYIFGFACGLLAAFGWAVEGVLSTHCMEQIDSDVAITVRELSSALMYALVVIPLCYGVCSVHAIPMEALLEHAVDAGFWAVCAGVAGGLSYKFYYATLHSCGIARAMRLNISYVGWSIPLGLAFTTQTYWHGLILAVMLIIAGNLLCIFRSQQRISIPANCHNKL